MKHRRPRSTRSNDQQVLTVIENKLKAHALGTEEMSPTQVMAARAVYDKLRPTLAAVEQTTIDKRDSLNAQELAAKLAAMFIEKPELYDQVLAIHARALAQLQPVESTAQAQHTLN